MLTDYIPGSKISALEEAFNRNLLASFVLVSKTSCYSHWKLCMFHVFLLISKVCGLFSVFVICTGKYFHWVGKLNDRYPIYLNNLSHFFVAWLHFLCVHDHWNCRLLWHSVKILVGLLLLLWNPCETRMQSGPVVKSTWRCTCRYSSSWKW